MFPYSYRSPASSIRNLEPAKRIASALTENRLAIARRLAEPIAKWEKYSNDLEQLGLDQFVERQANPLVDYLLNCMQSGRVVWWDLYVGERLKQCHHPADSLEQVLRRRRTMLSGDCQYLTGLLRTRADELELSRLTDLFERAIAAVGDNQVQECNILFVGDCLFLDVVSFLTAPLATDGIALRPIFLTSKNPSELRKDMRSAAGQKFDLVCYSPYSYEFDISVSQTHYSRGLTTGAKELNRLVAASERQTEANLRLLGELFECPICVHSAANFRRHDDSLGSYVKNVATRRARITVARQVSSRLERFIADYNRTAYQPLVLVDEQALLRQYGDICLGRKFYDSGTFHPTVFSQVLAELYREIISARVTLFDKKVLVTDLDNTLWSGAIGEGAVDHDHRRQKILRELRNKGILLAIASKNDPSKVRWDGASLNETDFVVSQINWRSKAANLKLIAEDLNLKLKDFVFLDDRPDEREMVKLAIPAVMPLDATSERTWRMLQWWAAALPEQTGGDRTQLYHQRRERQQFMDQAAEQLEAERLLINLQLRLEIKQPSNAALTRVAELINRTNQFNTCGTKTAMREVAGWRRSGRHLVLVGEAADKFGNMGLISVMVIKIGADALEILAWVLSCRVFGYGVETAMLNHVKRLCVQLGRVSVNGHLIETDENHPCRSVYSANGFTWDGDKWTCGAARELPDPEWLAVRIDQTAQTPTGAASVPTYPG